MSDLAALTVLHITAGSFGLAAGGTALLAAKGARLHRTAGNVFFIAMLLMATSGAALAVLKPAAAGFNVVIGTLTLYLVATSWATVLRKEGETGRFEMAALVAVLAIATGGLALGFMAANSKTGATADGIPAFLYFVFGGIAALAAAADASVILRRGVSGAQRIARHLWRMCFALLIGAIAFFIGQGAKIFPPAVRETKIVSVPILAVPVILIVVLMLFWLMRVLLTGWYRRPASRSPVEAN
jgi:hypothetical protein